jgi:glycosyltransferase involved in cell wall biosynthesis
VTGTPTVAHRLKRAAGRLLPRTSHDLVTVYRLLRSAYWWFPLPQGWKRALAGRVLTRIPALRQVGLMARAGIARDDKVLLVSHTAGARGNAQGLLLPPRKRILVVGHRIPTPDRDSASLRLSGMLRIIAEAGWEITFASVSGKAQYHWIFDDIDAQLPAYERWLEALGAQILYGPEALAGHLASHGGSYLCALLAYPEVMYDYAPVVRAWAPNATLVYDTVDLHGVRLAREARLHAHDRKLQARAEHYDRIERANIAGADLVIAVTPEEEAEILHRRPDVASAVVSNIHAATPALPDCRGRSGLLFIGHYLHTPNIDAMLHFVREVLPQVEELCGDVELFMLGSSMTEPVRALASSRVHAIGYIEDPAAWFDRARVFVAPLRFGAGMKGKIGHAMSLGLPVVTTPVGAEGMRLEAGRHALIADGAPDFARAVARLIEDDDLWRDMARAALDHVGRHFSQNAASQPMRGVLDHRKRSRRGDWARP